MTPDTILIDYLFIIMDMTTASEAFLWLQSNSINLLSVYGRNNIHKSLCLRRLQDSPCTLYLVINNILGTVDEVFLFPSHYNPSSLIGNVLPVLLINAEKLMVRVQAQTRLPCQIFALQTPLAIFHPITPPIFMITDWPTSEFKHLILSRMVSPSSWTAHHPVTLHLSQRWRDTWNITPIALFSFFKYTPGFMRLVGQRVLKPPVHEINFKVVIL